MICGQCSAADNFKTDRRKRVAHLLCPGKGWCDCQHRVGKEKIIPRSESGNQGQVDTRGDEHKEP